MTCKYLMIFSKREQVTNINIYRKKKMIHIDLMGILRVSSSGLFDNIMAENNIQWSGQGSSWNLFGSLLHSHPLPVSKLAILAKQCPICPIGTCCIRTNCGLKPKKCNNTSIIARQWKFTHMNMWKYSIRLTSVYLNCCSTFLMTPPHSKHLKAPWSSSGRTSLVRVTTPVTDTSLPISAVVNSLNLCSSITHILTIHN